MSRASVLLKSFRLKLQCFFKSLQKDGTVLATGDRIDGPLNWAYFTVMSLGKYNLLILFWPVYISHFLAKIDCSDIGKTSHNINRGKNVNKNMTYVPIQNTMKDIPMMSGRDL